MNDLTVNSKCNGWLAAMPCLAWLSGMIVSLPAHAGFVPYLLQDPGANLAATIMANQGAIANRDFAFPYGPLTLALQQLSLKLSSNGPAAMTVLQFAAALAFTLALCKSIRTFHLQPPAVLMLTATAFMVTALPWPPVYELEAAILAWALLARAISRPDLALALCATGAMIKPSMAFVLGALFFIELLWRRRNRWREWKTLAQALLAPLLPAGILAAHFGWPGFWSMINPAVGARNYHALAYSFFSRRDNPFLIPGMRPGYYLGTPLVAWMVGIWLLGALAIIELFKIRSISDRLMTGLSCFLASLIFIFAFYGPAPSFYYYAAFPAIGLAWLPAPERWKWLLYPAAALMLLGNYSALRSDLGLWRHEHRYSATAGLWARPAIATEWQTQWAARTRQHIPFIGESSPRVIFPSLGKPWHGYLVPGEATARERTLLTQRLSTHACSAISPEWILEHPPNALTALRATTPVLTGRLYDLYCRKNFSRD